MKITIEITGPDAKEVDRKVSVETTWDSDIYETVDVIAGALIAAGFHPDSVVDGFDCYVGEHEKKEEEDEEHPSDR